jgi:molybdenum cofactor biosynthesis enzyme MoaA
VQGIGAESSFTNGGEAMTAEEDEDTKLPRMRAKIIEGQAAQISKVKADIETWIDEHYQDHSLDVVVMNALLELAFERFIDLHGKKDALELIELRFRRTSPPL